MGRYVGELLWLLASPAAATVAAAAPRGAALVIGNAAYEEGQLRNPVNDATAIAVALRDLGFEVTLLKQQFPLLAVQFSTTLSTAPSNSPLPVYDRLSRRLFPHEQRTTLVHCRHLS